LIYGKRLKVNLIQNVKLKKDERDERN